MQLIISPVFDDVSWSVLPAATGYRLTKQKGFDLPVVFYFCDARKTKVSVAMYKLCISDLFRLKEEMALLSYIKPNSKQ